MAEPEIHVQLCYAEPALQILRELSVAPGTTLQEAIIQSGVLREVDAIDLAACQVGIYGKLKAPDTVLREHDRIEIYRPLRADPMETRRRRAAHNARLKADPEAGAKAKE
ncbi:RnfH family protein [Oxalobacteraceae bacterium CAVE-383]|nr:RnfH family protein [Oxalobacteraceae bacterium CAVE-383]